MTKGESIYKRWQHIYTASESRYSPEKVIWVFPWSIVMSCSISYTSVHLVKSVENCALCIRGCLACSSYMNVMHYALVITRTLCYGASPKHLILHNWNPGFFPGVPPSGKNFVNSPPSDTCPCFWTKACPPQPRFVPENLTNLNKFLCQIWLLLSSKVP